LRSKVDLLLFNPPYVPTPSEEVCEGGIAAAWAGGERGREVLDRFLTEIPLYLSERGVFYLVTVIENDPKEIADILSKKGLACSKVAERHAANEKLATYRFTRGS